MVRLAHRLRLDIAMPLAVLATGLIAAVLIGFSVSGEIDHIHGEAVHETEQRLLGASQALGEHVDSTVSAIDVATLYLRNIWENDRPRFPEAAAEIRRAAIPGLILHVTVTDRDGQVTFSSQTQSGRTDSLRAHESFQAQTGTPADSLVISKPVEGLAPSEARVEISRRMTDRDGRFDGIVVIAILADDMIRIYDHLGLGEEGSIGLIGTDRVVRARQSHITRETHLLSDTLPADRPYFKTDAPSWGVFHTASGGIDQRPRIIAYRRLDHYPLIVYVSDTDLDIVARTAPHDRLLVQWAGLGAVSIVTFSLAVALLFRRLLRNQAKLAAAERDLRQINHDLEDRVASEVAINRQKDHILIQQSRLAAMGEMVHNIAHQWRQPLNSLSLLISNLRDDVFDPAITPGELERDVATARRLIEKMSTIIDEFRDFFRPDREATTFDVAGAVRDAIAIIDASARNNRIDLTADLAANLMASGYPNQYAQAVLNLIVNAKEALVERRTVGGRIAISLTREGTRAVLAVEDNAGGIAADILPKIFDPYFTTKDQGSGIGLYMAKIIIERNMGGSITAIMTKSGSRFIIGVPLAEG